MKYSKIFISSLLLFFSSWLSAQEGNWCGIEKLIENQLVADPLYKTKIHQGLIAVAGNRSSSEAKKATLVIPCVVHLIHDNGIGNISDEQIFSAFDSLNVDYQRLNADSVETRGSLDAPFKAIAGGMDVEFRLAKIDPWGSCTNGIIRVNAPHLTYDAGEDCKFTSNGGSSAWPKDKYFNIWVVNTIDSEGSSGIIAGYAWYPYGAENNDGYGILINNTYMGTIGTAAYGDGRVLTHEMGHALGLPHIFDQGINPVDGCHSDDCYTYGDYSCDTPPQKEASWNCSSTWNSCAEIPVNDPFGFDAMDQIENYMSYNSCQNMFSQDQVNVMTNNLTSIGFLADLVSTSNLASTGANLPDVFCKAEFEAYKRVICSGTDVSFYDYSFTEPTTWNWSLTPGTEGVDYVFVSSSSASSQNPVIQFITSGYYSVSLMAGDGSVSDAETKTNYIQVLPNDAGLPFWEGFESYSSLASTTNWAVKNEQNNEAFDVYPGTAYSGSKCIRLLNYSETIGSVDELLGSPIDLSGLDPLSDQVTLSFRYAYRKRSSMNDEWLKVFVSSTCGDTWVQRKTLHGDVLSALTYPGSWTPSSQTDWTTVHMTNVTSSYFSENFRMKFRFESDGGNNFYLDDINLYGGDPSDEIVMGIADQEAINLAVTLFPNPGSEELNLRFNLNQDAGVWVRIEDLHGRFIQEHRLAGVYGENLLLMDVQDLAAGSYHVILKTDGNQEVFRWIKK